MNKYNTKMKKIAILTFPLGKSGCVATSNLVDILCSISNDIHLVTGNAGYDFFKGDTRIHVYEIRHESGSYLISRVFFYFLTQLKMIFKLLKTLKNVDIWIFFIGGNLLVLPMSVLKFLRKKVIMIYAGSSYISFASTGSNLSILINIIENVNSYLSDYIILYSPSLIKEWCFLKYRNKIHIASRHFLNLKEFKIKKKFENRSNSIGYVGRLSEEKGLLNFAKAIKEISKENYNLNYFIGGDGELRNQIEKYFEKERVFNVKIIGWISHEQLPDFLNDLKLIVLPSYTEGLPNIILEAMACGTPVLANSVGSIPDIIKDGETGFIMEDNSPKCIAKNIQRVLSYPNLDQIIKNARALILREFTYEAAVDRYRKIFYDLLESSK